MYANTLITIPNSSDEDETKIIIRRTPSPQEIATIILSTDESSDEKTTSSSNKKTTSSLKNSLRGLQLTKTPSYNQHHLKRRHQSIQSVPSRIGPYLESHNTNAYNNAKKIDYQYIKRFLNSPRYATITIEGNIGVGKSTFIEKLKDISHFNVTTIREPIEKWMNHDGINLLEQQYANPQNLSFNHWSWHPCYKTTSNQPSPKSWKEVWTPLSMYS